MDNLESVIAKLEALAHTPPPMQPLMRAAARTAQTTTAQLRAANVPARVVVRQLPAGVRLMIVTTGPITKRLTVRPLDVLRRNLVSGFPQARNELADAVTRMLK